MYKESSSEWTPGVGDEQGGLACCDSWGRKESDMTERLIWSDLISFSVWVLVKTCENSSSCTLVICLFFCMYFISSIQLHTSLCLRTVGKEFWIWSNVYSNNFHHLVLVTLSVFMIHGSQGISLREGITDVSSYLCLQWGLLIYHQGKTGKWGRCRNVSLLLSL